MTTSDTTPAPIAALRSRAQRARHLLARIVRRSERLAGESRTAMAILRAQQEATLEGSLVVDNEGHILSYNRRFLDIWQIPEPPAEAKG